MNLTDLLVSYKQVGTPEIDDFTLPTLKTPKFSTTAKKVAQPTQSGFRYIYPTQSSATPIKSFKGKRGEWVNTMKKAYMDNGASEQFAKYLIAQDAQESGWGAKVVGNYNFGNIKAGSSWKGSTVYGTDNQTKSRDPYRSYSSVTDYAHDKLALLRNNYGINGTESFEQFLDKLQGNNAGKRHYAEAKNYKNALRSVYASLRFGGILE